MSRTTFCFLLFLFMGLSFADWASEGDQHLFLCVGNVKREIPILWKLRRSDGTETKLMFCTSESCDPETDRIPYEANITRNGEIFHSFLLIKNVTLDLHKTQWICFVDSNTGSYLTNINTTFNLFVFVLPEQQLCYNPMLSKEINIEIQCITDKVFPEAICEFFVKSDASDPVIVKNQAIVYSNRPSITSGYRTECNLTLSGNILGPGTHLFYVVMYPNVTTNLTVNMRRSSNYTDPITINYPKAALAAECQVNDYIKENETIVCTCYNNNTSLFPTKVYWSNETSIEGRLPIVARRPLTVEEKFTCSIFNRLNWTDKIDYKPNVAYGPDRVILNLNISDLHLCSNRSIDIYVTCSVSDSNPEPAVFIGVGDLSIQPTRGKEKNEYSFNTTIFSPGNFNISCSAKNPVFGNIISAMNQPIKINGPTEAFLIASSKTDTHVIQPEGVLFVSEGIMSITCQMTEILLNTTIVLLCGKQENYTTNEDVVFLALNISKETESLTCICTFWPRPYCQRNAFYFNIKINQAITSDYSIAGPVLIVGWTLAAFFGVVLFISIASFTYRHKFLGKNGNNQSVGTLNESSAYSNLQDQQGREGSNQCNYETPVFRENNAINTEATSSFDVYNTDPYLNTEEQPYMEVTDSL